MPGPTEHSGFLSRWSQRKLQAREGLPQEEVPAEPVQAPQALLPQPAPQLPATPAPPAATAPAEAAPTLADVAALQHDSDFRRFVAPGVDSGVKHAALKKLFSDPHFNLMDGLDTYIDDYGRPDPLPAGMLQQLAQSQALGLFRADAPTDPAAATVPVSLAQATPDEDAALRLQPHDAAGPPGAAAGPVPDTGRQC